MEVHRHLSFALWQRCSTILPVFKYLPQTAFHSVKRHTLSALVICARPASETPVRARAGPSLLTIGWDRRFLDRGQRAPFYRPRIESLKFVDVLILRWRLLAPNLRRM